ncbi:alpha/beta hydrolase [Saccharopolyspora rosea]|uniref:Alpha/beta hydrolase n=1 Tax=Saccharopolyspora rosea TaxID=524884 RepID=A0ABW3FUB2_9PSEU
MTTPLRLVLSAALLLPLLGVSPTAAGTARFHPCPDVGPDVECTEIQVPLDYSDPFGPHLQLAISRVRATGTPAEHRGTLVVNPGGPGGSGLAYAATKRAKMPESVRRSYDVVGFDPRGVGRSSPVDCGPLGGLFAHPGPDPLHDPARLPRLRAMASDCRRHAGALFAHVGTTDAVRDLDRVRRALGEPRLDFLGVSYGSYLGAAYAAQFPGQVGRMVLDSVVSPDRWHDFDVQQAVAMLDQREVLFGWIAEHPSLGLGSTPAAVREHYERARAALAEHPARGTFGPREFDHLVYRALSRTERWEPFARALADYATRGDAAGLAPELPETDVPARNYEAALRTVKCADSPRPSPAEVVDSVRALRARDPLPILTGLEAAGCAFWPPPREPARLGSPAMPPVLLVQADHDPTTPYEGARRMQRRLPGSRMVTLLDGYSHGVFASQRNRCADDAVAAYLLRGALPAHDLACPGPGLPPG